MYRYFLMLPESLSRTTSGGRFIGEIDGLRFLAIFAVLIQQMSERLQVDSPLSFAEGTTNRLLADTAGRSFIGIYIFFVISGFVLAIPFASHYLKGSRPVTLKTYFMRRITRLVPPYFLLMTFFFLLLVLLQTAPIAELLPNYLAGVFYVHSLVFQPSTGIHPLAWVLEIEMQFYILAPLLASVFFRLRRPYMRRLVLVEAIVIIMVLQQQFGFYQQPWKFSILGNLHLFLAGFLLADFYLAGWKEGVKKSWSWDVLLLAALPMPFISWGQDFINWIIFPFLLVLLVTGVFRSIYFNRFFTSKWIMAIGGMGYTVYLVHWPVAELMARLSRYIPPGESYFADLLLQLAVFLPLMSGLSVLFFLGLEKPCMDKDWPQKAALGVRKLLCSIYLARADARKKSL